MRLKFARLDSIARAVAFRSVGLEMDDVYQEIWLMFLRYPPRYETAAFRMARHARIAVWRKERSWYRLKERLLAGEQLKAAAKKERNLGLMFSLMQAVAE